MFDRADFRGLLHADYSETIRSAFSKPTRSSGGYQHNADENKSQMTKAQVGTVSAQAVRESQVATSEFQATAYNPKVFNNFLRDQKD